MYKSSVVEEGSFDVVTSQYDSPYLVDGYYNYYFTLDNNDNPIYKDWTCDADFAAQMDVVNTIKENYDWDLSYIKCKIRQNRS